MSFTHPHGSIAPAAPPKRYKRSVGGSDLEGGFAVVLQPLQPQAAAAAISRIRIRPGSRICGPGDIQFPSLVVETLGSELLFREISAEEGREEPLHAPGWPIIASVVHELDAGAKSVNAIPFGPFVLERRLAVGGSAEVFLARPRSGEAPAPRLVVK